MYDHHITFTSFDDCDLEALIKSLKENQPTTLYLELTKFSVAPSYFTDSAPHISRFPRLVEAVKANTSIVDLRIKFAKINPEYFPFDAIEAILTANRHIKCAGFHGCSLSGELAVNFARSLKKFPLMLIDFSDSHLEGETLEKMLAELAENQFLRGLILSGNGLGNLSETGLLSLLRQNRLAHLEVCETALTKDDYTKIFKAIGKHKESRFETLNLSFLDQRVRDSDVIYHEVVGDRFLHAHKPIDPKDLAQLVTCKKLTKLYLNGCRFSDDVSLVLKELLDKLPALQCLDLRFIRQLNYAVIFPRVSKALQLEHVALGCQSGIYIANSGFFLGRPQYSNVIYYDEHIEAFETLLTFNLKTLILNNIHFTDDNFVRFCNALTSCHSLTMLVLQQTHLAYSAYMLLAATVSTSTTLNKLRIEKIRTYNNNEAGHNVISASWASTFIDVLTKNFSLEEIVLPGIDDADVDMQKVALTRNVLVARNVSYKKDPLLLADFFQKVATKETTQKEVLALLERHGEHLQDQAELASDADKIKFADIMLAHQCRAQAVNLLTTIPASSHFYPAACFTLGNVYYSGTNVDFDFASDQERLEQACLVLWQAKMPVASELAAKAFLQLTYPVGEAVSPQDQVLLTSVDDTVENNLKLARVLREKNTRIAELERALKKAEAGKEVKPVTPTFFGCAR